MLAAKITSKGQITLPKAVRDALHLATGDRVSFVLREDGVVEMQPLTVTITELVGILGGDGTRQSVDDMNAAVRRAAGHR
jgi:AbrB family looped-hinge helix DNA binding protein